MLAALKIFAEHIEGLKPLAEFLADQPEEDNGLSTQRTPRDAENAEAK
jgi:hypothetical protein